MENVEIERKWLMDGFPALPCEKEIFTEQGYLSFTPVTVRIRRQIQPESGKTLGCCMTVKGKGTLCRAEVEFEIAPEKYRALVPLLAAPIARKRLKLYRLPAGQLLECSLVDEGEPGAFYYAEVEFASEVEARSFVPPAFLGREVTEEAGHTMAAYCQKKAAAGP